MAEGCPMGKRQSFTREFKLVAAGLHCLLSLGPRSHLLVSCKGNYIPSIVSLLTPSGALRGRAPFGSGANPLVLLL